MPSQGASNGPGQGAGQSFVKFSRQSAQRIAKAVRTVEGGDRGQAGITFDHPQPTAKAFRICTYTATSAWTKGTSKTVEFRYQTTTPNTAVATNLFANVGTASSGVACAIARDGTAWFLIAAECN